MAWCLTYQPTEPPGSLLGAAIRYVLSHRIALTRFLEDGRLPIDNGIVERLHRRPAVGRRNFLFAGSHAGAERAAIAYSVIATCTGFTPRVSPASTLGRYRLTRARSRWGDVIVAAGEMRLSLSIPLKAPSPP